MRGLYTDKRRDSVPLFPLSCSKHDTEGTWRFVAFTGGGGG